MFARGKKNSSSTVRHRPVNFICKKAVIFLYSIFTASDLKKKKGFYLLPIVNLLDSYKVYHKLDPPICGRVSWNWLLVMFFFFFCDGALVLVLMRSHTHTSCAPFMHSSASPLTTLPLSPSVVGLLSQTSTFRPFFLATSTYFVFYFTVFSCFLFVCS